MTRDAGERVLQLVDARNKTSTFRWDDDDRRAAWIDPLGRRTTWGYDAAGRNTGRRDVAGMHD